VIVFPSHDPMEIKTLDAQPLSLGVNAGTNYLITAIGQHTITATANDATAWQLGDGTNGYARVISTTTQPSFNVNYLSQDIDFVVNSDNDTPLKVDAGTDKVILGGSLNEGVPQVITGTTTAVSTSVITVILKSSGGVATGQLPTSPADGDTYRFIALDVTSGAPVIDGNGKLIVDGAGLAATITLPSVYQSTTVEYLDNLGAWVQW